MKLNKAKMHFVKNSKDLIAVEISKNKSLLKGKFFRNGHNRKKSCHDICDSRISWVKLHQIGSCKYGRGGRRNYQKSKYTDDNEFGTRRFRNERYPCI